MGFQSNNNTFRHIAIATDWKFIGPQHPGENSNDDEDECDGKNPFDAGAGYSMHMPSHHTPESETSRVD